MIPQTMDVAMVSPSVPKHAMEYVFKYICKKDKRIAEILHVTHQLVGEDAIYCATDSRNMFFLGDHELHNDQHTVCWALEDHLEQTKAEREQKLWSTHKFRDSIVFEPGYSDKQYTVEVWHEIYNGPYNTKVNVYHLLMEDE